MTERRKEELLAKIKKVADNDATAFAGVESDIQVSRDNQSGDIEIDLAVHFIVSDEDESDKMNVSYSACKSYIKNATIEQQERACVLMNRIIKASLNGMAMEGGENQRAAIEQALNEQASQNMIGLLQQNQV